jgi:hypothetical protein
MENMHKEKSLLEPKNWKMGRFLLPMAFHLRASSS